MQYPPGYIPTRSHWASEFVGIPVAVSSSEPTTRHDLARAVFHGRRGDLYQAHRSGQEDQLGALGLVVNAIESWKTDVTWRAKPPERHRFPQSPLLLEPLHVQVPWSPECHQFLSPPLGLHHGGASWVGFLEPARKRFRA